MKILEHVVGLQNPVDSFPQEVIQDIQTICDEYPQVIREARIINTTTILFDVKIEKKIDDRFIFYADKPIQRTVPIDTSYDEPLCMIFLVLKHFLGRNFMLKSNGLQIVEANQKKYVIPLGNWKKAIEKLQSLGYNLNLGMVLDIYEGVNANV